MAQPESKKNLFTTSKNFFHFLIGKKHYFGVIGGNLHNTNKPTEDHKGNTA